MSNTKDLVENLLPRMSAKIMEIYILLDSLIDEFRKLERDVYGTSQLTENIIQYESTRLECSGEEVEDEQ